MRVIFLPAVTTVALSILLWGLLQVMAAVISNRLPARYFDHHQGFFATRRWERGGRIYQTLFRIRRWKHLLPDGGAMVRGGYAKKHLQDYSLDNLDQFLIESCRAELSHWLAILPFWVFGFIAPPDVVLYMLAYALAVNMPCVLAQRFNRPRIEKVRSALAGRRGV